MVLADSRAVGYDAEMESTEAPYHQLTPELILRAVESQGYHCDGRFYPLNSYENRVYQIGVEQGPALIAKFYRPARWSRAAILEEHEFALELAGHEIPVVAPLKNQSGATLHELGGFQFALYPRCGGRWPDLETKQDRQQMGRFLGRLHAVGAIKPFQQRQAVTVERLGVAPRDYILNSGLLPDYLVEAYATLSNDLIKLIADRFEQCGRLQQLRLHGDCHPGNILWTDNGPHFVDLDDCVMGPAVQDLWMLLSGDELEVTAQLEDYLQGYETFYAFDHTSLVLIEPLRTLRLMYYAAWLARRWHDPAFPIAFPWFAEPRYWEEHILSLREQAALLT